MILWYRGREARECGQAGEVKTCMMHDVKGARCRRYDVQDVDIVEFTVGDVVECGYVSTQVEEYVGFDGCLGLSKAAQGKGDRRGSMVKESKV